MQLPDEFAQACLEEIDVGKNLYAHAKAERERLDKMLGIVRARLSNAYLSTGTKAAQKAQIQAMQDRQYEHAVDQYVAAVAAEVKAEWTLKILEMKFAGWRTISSNRRANL